MSRRILFGVARGVRGRHLLVLDLLGVLVGSYLALSLRFGLPASPDYVLEFLPVPLMLLGVRTAINSSFGLYSHSWRQASIPDLARISKAVLVGSVITIAAFYGSGLLLGRDWLPGFPRSFFLGEALLTIAFTGGVRLAIRVAADIELSLANVVSTTGTPMLLFGAGHTGALMARSALRDHSAGVMPVGFLDEDRRLRGSHVAGLPVFGDLGTLERAVQATGARMLLITMPSAGGSAVRRVVNAAAAIGLDVRTVPPVTDLLDGSLDANRVRRVRVEDLLRRPMVTEHAVGVAEIVAGKTVLITGAAGSIGSELARQVFSFGPSRLILVDRAESPLYLMQRELELRRRNGRGSGELRIHLGNVASRASIQRLIAEERPGVIFHAAAYKHVPMMEEHPSDAVHVNIRGTQVLLEAAAEAGVERFVFVSTDKAVRPSSAMGASKRIAEMLVRDMAKRTGRPYVSVRFGNVLGSNGSVVPIFQEQLENGEPLTVTHPEMTRYFMTIPEAAWLILDAAALGTNGDLFVLDMGEPVRIMDLARDLIRLAGRDPDSHPIKFVGLRQGEKLHEELFYDPAQAQPTSAPKVLKVLVDPPPPSIHEVVRQLLALATGDDEPRLRGELIAYAHSLEPLAQPALPVTFETSGDGAATRIHSPAMPAGVTAATGS